MASATQFCISTFLIAGCVLPGTAAADRIELHPTGEDASLQQSMRLVSDLYEAIDNGGEVYPGGERTIEFAAGVYDLSALLIVDPSRPHPPKGYTRTTAVASGVTHTIDVFNPHGFSLDLLALAPGIPMRGVEGLTLQGAPLDARGQPTTVLLGNVEAGALSTPLDNGVGFFNRMFALGGRDGTPSRDVAIERLTFRGWNTAGGAVDDTSAFPPNAPFAGGTIDLLVKDCRFEVDPDYQGLFLVGSHDRPVIRDNRFVSPAEAPFPTGWLHLNILGAGEGERVRDMLVTNNTFEYCYSCLRLFDRQAGVRVVDNEFVLRSGAGHALLALEGSHGALPSHPLTSGHSEIAHNDVQGGYFGMAIFNGADWYIHHNRVEGAIIALWTEWGPFAFPAHGTLRLMPARDNRVEYNDLRGNTIGVFVGANAVGNTYVDNDVTDNTYAGYFVNGADDLGFLLMPAASDNTIVGSMPRSEAEIVVDATGCYGTQHCPQSDEDGDGTRDEDPSNGLNDDGDVAFGLALQDEDPTVHPNHYVDIPSVVAPAAGPHTADSDGDGLRDMTERKLRAEGYCVDPHDPDTDDDGISDGEEFQDGTLEPCDTGR